MCAYLKQIQAWPRLYCVIDFGPGKIAHFPTHYLLVLKIRSELDGKNLRSLYLKLRYYKANYFRWSPEVRLWFLDVTCLEDGLRISDYYETPSFLRIDEYILVYSLKD